MARVLKSQFNQRFAPSMFAAKAPILRRLLRMSVRIDTPGAQAGFRDDHLTFFRKRYEMPEYERIAPGKRLFGVANGVIFVAVGILHHQHADAIGTKLRRKPAILLPIAMIVA